MNSSWLENLEPVKMMRAEIAVLRAELQTLKKEIEDFSNVTAAAVNAIKQESDAARTEAAEGIMDVMQSVCDSHVIIARARVYLGGVRDIQSTGYKADAVMPAGVVAYTDTVERTNTAKSAKPVPKLV